MLRRILKPFRKLLTKLIFFEEKVSDFALKDINLSLYPIDIAANYVCSEEVEGDYLEFGVFRGFSFIKAYHSLNYFSNSWNNFERTKNAYTDLEVAKKAYKEVKKIQRKFFAFDSFKGLPQIKEIDSNHPKFKKGRYDFSKKNFLNELVKNNVEIKNVQIIEGYYNETLSEPLKIKLNLKKAAVVMIDCDLYDSTKDVLKFITNLVHDGSILIFDDWYTFKGNSKKGQQLACSEWLEKNHNIKLIDYKVFGPYQKSFIVNLKN